jgi:hypothetical protein
MAADEGVSFIQSKIGLFVFLTCSNSLLSHIQFGVKKNHCQTRDAELNPIWESNNNEYRQRSRTLDSGFLRLFFLQGNKNA